MHWDIWYRSGLFGIVWDLRVYVSGLFGIFLDFSTIFWDATYKQKPVYWGRLKNQIFFTKSVKKLNCIDDLIYITTTWIFGCIDVDYLSHYPEIYLDEYIQVTKH